MTSHCAHSAHEDEADDSDDGGHGGGLEVSLCLEGADHTETPLTRDHGGHELRGPCESCQTCDGRQVGEEEREVDKFSMCYQTIRMLSAFYGEGVFLRFFSFVLMAHACHVYI